MAFMTQKHGPWLPWNPSCIPLTWRSRFKLVQTTSLFMQTPSNLSLQSAWRLQDAKAQFNELVDNALRGVPQHVTRRGKQAVVVLSEADFEALQRNAANCTKKPKGLIEHLLSMPKMPTQSRLKKSSGADPEFPSVDVTPREIDFS